jgi:hypothetical protein
MNANGTMAATVGISHFAQRLTNPSASRVPLRDGLKIKGSLIVDLESLGARPEVQGDPGAFQRPLLKITPPFENGVCYGVMWELRAVKGAKRIPVNCGF